MIAEQIDVEYAGGLLEQIYAQLGEASTNEVVLEQSWMRLGQLLARCKSTEAWRPVFPSLEEFMLDLRNRYNRGKTQLWSYLTVAEKLLPLIDAPTLEKIGISKALELKRALKKSGGKPIPQEIIDKAQLRDTTIKELRALVAQAFNLAPDDKGAWFDLDGFFVTPDEKKEFVETVRMTIAYLNIGKDVPDHIQRKAVIMAWMQEFKGAHMAEVYGPQELQNTPATLMLPQNVAVPDAIE